MLYIYYTVLSVRISSHPLFNLGDGISWVNLRQQRPVAAVCRTPGIHCSFCLYYLSGTECYFAAISVEVEVTVIFESAPNWTYHTSKTMHMQEHCTVYFVPINFCRHSSAGVRLRRDLMPSLRFDQVGEWTGTSGLQYLIKRRDYSV